MKLDNKSRPNALVMVLVAVVTFVTTLAMFWTDAG